MICAICGGAAVDRTPSDYDGTKIDCPDCGRKYAIAGTIQNKFQTLGTDERVAAFRKAIAHASLGMRPLISSSEL